MLSRTAPRAPRLSPRAVGQVTVKRVRQKLGIRRVDQARRTPWHVLRGNSGFRRYFFGSVASDFGTWLQNTALVLLRIRMRAEAGPKRRSRIRDGFLIARRDRRIMILLLMVAAVIVADDPILVLGPALAKQLHAPSAWSSWFIAAPGGHCARIVPPNQAPPYAPAGSERAGSAGPVHALVRLRPVDMDRGRRRAGRRRQLPSCEFRDACRPPGQSEVPLLWPCRRLPGRAASPWLRWLTACSVVGSARSGPA